MYHIILFPSCISGCCLEFCDLFHEAFKVIPKAVPFVTHVHLDTI